jgi:hypothetical protein
VRGGAGYLRAGAALARCGAGLARCVAGRRVSLGAATPVKVGEALLHSTPPVSSSLPSSLPKKISPNFVRRAACASIVDAGGELRLRWLRTLGEDLR